MPYVILTMNIDYSSKYLLVLEIAYVFCEYNRASKCSITFDRFLASKY